MASGLDAARARRRFGSTANKDTCTRFKACRIVARPPPRHRGPGDGLLHARRLIGGCVALLRAKAILRRLVEWLWHSRIVARPPPRRRGPHPRPMVKPAGNVAPLPCVVMWATLRHFLVWRAENLESWRDSAVVWYGACPLVGCLGGFLVDKLRATPLNQTPMNRTIHQPARSNSRVYQWNRDTCLHGPSSLGLVFL